MGFAASQARFLSLTARLSDIEYEAQQISQERLSLNNQMELYSDAYYEATENQALFANVFVNNGQNQENVVLSYDVIVGDQLNGGLGMQLVTSSGKVVVPDQETMYEKIANSNGKYSEIDFFIFEDIKDTTTLQKNLEQGNMSIAARNADSGDWDRKSIEQLSQVTRSYDKSDDAVAKALYDKRIKTAEARDSMLEMRLEQLNSEHKAIETEMDSVQKVIDGDIESSFKTFG